MLVREGDARNQAIDRRLAITLAGTAGALNAAAFHAVGFFAANMTGNLSLIADRLATAAWLASVFLMAIIALFVVGAAAATVVIDIGRRRDYAAYASCVGFEALTLVLLGFTDLMIHVTWWPPVMVLGLSFLMGLQNAVTTRISDARVRTTHVSGVLTDMGIELASLVGSSHREDAADIRSRLGLHIATVTAFLSGGVIGIFAYDELRGGLMIAAGSLLAWLAVPVAFRSARMT